MDNDTISRQAAISFIENVPYIKSHQNMGDLIKAWLEQIPAVQPEQRAGKWIKCSDRMPEESDGTVLVCFPDEFPYSNKEPYVNAKHNQRVKVASYSQFNNTWYIGDFGAIGEVRPIAWMLLPELPEVK